MPYRHKPTELDEGLPEPKFVTKDRAPGFGRGLVITSLLVGFLAGIVGGAGSLFYLQKSGKLGPISITTTKTERINLEEGSAFIDTTNKVKPAVVSISSEITIEDFFGRVVSQQGGGTGFIITADGLIVTNKHVVSDDGAKYTVFLNDGRSFEAKVLARDPFNDLAVIKIEERGLPTVELGDSDNLKVGQWVVAIGNALGQFENSVTVGVVSAKERTIEVENGERLEGLLQTDAAINQGNSGGPLVNLKGQVVGINTAVAAKGFAEGIGFAIPINTVKTAIDQVVVSGKIVRPYIGIRYIPVTKDVAERFDLSSDHGVWLATRNSILAGSPAEKADLMQNDIIVEFDGKEINENQTLAKLLLKFKPGDTVTLTVLRSAKQEKIELTLSEFK